MQKNYTKFFPRPTGYIPKLLLMMKITTFILLFSLMQVSASSFGQRLNLVDKNVSIEKVLREIKRQTNFNILVESTNFKTSTRINTNFNNASLETVMDAILSGTDMTYVLENNNVIIKPKQKSFFERVIENMLAIEVKGKVVDENGKAFPGATVRVKGISNGTITAEDGTFLLKNVSEDSAIEITSIGYKTVELKAAKDLGTIRMQTSVGNLQEVGVTVNTGYQKIKPEQSTGAVSQLSTKEYESRISTNFLDGLVNRLPGLMINNNVDFVSTTPGSASSNSRSLFNIRGISTMSANQSPLIVIDGYPTELTLNMIDPNEIKSITILKDAAAATVYGVRASNGVIVIERKMATAGKAQFQFRTTLGLTPKEDYNRYRWADDASSIVSNYQRTTQSAIVNNTSYGLLFTQAQGAIRRSTPYYILAQAAANMITPVQLENAFSDLANYNNINDYSRLFLRTAATQTHNLNLSGGSDNALYYITANYTGNTSSQVLNDNNRFQLAGRSRLKLSKKLSLDLNTEYYESRSNSAPIPSLSNIAPYQRFQDLEGNPSAITAMSFAAPYNTFLLSQGLEDHNYYPLVDMNEVSDKSRSVNNSVNADFRYAFGSGFTLNFGGIYQTSRSESRHFASERSSEVKQYINGYAFRNTDGTFKYNIPKGGFLRDVNSNISSYTARAQLNFNKVIGSSHSFNVIAGGEIRNLINKATVNSAFGYNDETLLQQAVDYAAITSGLTTVRGTYVSGTLTNQLEYLFNQQFSEDRFLSGYSNAVYSFKDTYSLSGSIRIDQSNLFGTNPKYKYKPLWSVGAGWNIDREKFMSNLTWIKQLKLRAAYGFNGNVAKLSLPEVIARPVNNIQTSPTSQALKLVSYANSSLRWEQTQNLNGGLDFSIFKNVNGTIEAYTKKSTDLLGNSLIDPTLGVSPTLVNKATIRNTGIEFRLNADWISTSKLNWNTGIAFANNRSKVLEVYRRGNYNPQTLNVLGYVQGYPVGAMFGYRYVGLSGTTGAAIIKDQNGVNYPVESNLTSSPLTTLMSSETSGVTRYVGPSTPSINAGLSNRVDIGNRFYVFAMIHYYGGFRVQAPRSTPNSLRPYEGAGNYWKVPGDELKTDIIALAYASGANTGNAYTFADTYMVHGDYLTLGDVTVSYNFNNLNFIKKAGIRNVELKAQASNLYTVGLNRFNYSRETRSFDKTYATPTYTLALFTNF